MKVQLEYLKVAINTAMQYKTNFIIQVLSMGINDLVWLVFWMLFFNKFKNVGTWSMDDIILLYAIITIAYGLAGILFGNRRKISGIIAEGRLDYYLALPKNVLYHVLISRTNWYDLGDLIFGIILVVLYVPIAKVPLLILLVIMSTIIYLSFMIIVGSLAFFIGNSQAIEHTLGDAVVGMASYPLQIYKGFTKFLVLVIIPAGFITGVPVELLKQFNLQWFLLMAGFTILIFIISITVFYFGLKKYESGNLLYVRA